MKRFLSVLLASLLVLGTMSLTVSADVEFGLNVDGARAQLANEPFAVAGRKVMFNIPTLADGQTVKYFNGETEVTPEAGLVAGTVALTVNANENKFTAKIYNGEELVSTSPVVKVYGVANKANGTRTGYGTSSTKNETDKNTIVDTSTLDPELKAALEADGRTTIITGKSDLGFITGALTSDINYTENSIDAYWTGAELPSSTIKMFYHRASGSNRCVFGMAADYELYAHNGAGSTNPAAANRTGVDMPANEWVNFIMDHYYETGAFDVYMNNVLIVKSCLSSAGRFTSFAFRNQQPVFDGLYFSRRSFDVNATLYNPTLELTASAETVGEVAVTKRDLPADATVYIYKNGVKGEAVDFAGADAATVTLTGEGEAAVYAQVEFADGSVAFDVYGDDLKTAESTIAFPAANPFTEAVVATVNSGGVGVVTFDDTLLEEDEASIVIVKNDGTIERKVYTKGVDETTQTFTNVSKLFVWKWGTMVPLCYAATID